MKKIFGDTTSIGGITTTTQRTAESPQVLSISGTTSPTTTAQRGGQLVVRQTAMEPTYFPEPYQAFRVITVVCNADMFNESGSFTIRFELDGGADSGYVNINSLNPNECTLAWWDFPSGLPSGEHYIYVYLSPGLNVGYIGFKVED